MKNPVKFGKYYLLERINVGGMAEVFKAKSFGEAGFERLVAVKRVLPSIAEDQEFIAMFIDEAKLAVQLTHPNIAQIFELGKVGEAYFIALEYVPGKDLRAIFDRARKRGEPIPIPMACYLVMKICEGLDYAHNKKDAAGRNLELVHRDVSPQNMLISYDGDVKLIDFGIAKAASKSSKTQAGILKGKFGYMSPEQVRGLAIDRRSDIFSIGICLYELLTMERLFVGESDFSTLEKVRNVEIMPPSTYNRKIPEELEQIVLKALAKHPEDRYRTAMDLHDDLQSFMYTSGNFFARKDLSAYMQKIFGDEIAKEAARDEEYRKFDSRRATDLDVFDGAAAPPNGAQVNRNAPPPPPPVPPKASVPPPPPPQAGGQNRAGRSTMMGMGMGPPAAGARAAAAAAAPVAAPPPPRASGPVPAAAAAPAQKPQAIDMDWDDEELATQVYDKPEDAPSPGPARPLPAAGNRVSGGVPNNAQPAAPPRVGPPAVNSTMGFAQQRAPTANVPAVNLGAPKSLPPIPAPPPMNGAGPMMAPQMNAMGQPAAPAPMPPTMAQPMVGNGMGGPMMGAPPMNGGMMGAAIAPPGYPQAPPGYPQAPGFNGAPMNGGPGRVPNGMGGAMPLEYRADASQATAVSPAPQRRNGAVFIFAGLGVIAVAAAVVVGLRLFGSHESAGTTATQVGATGAPFVAQGANMIPNSGQPGAPVAIGPNGQPMIAPMGAQPPVVVQPQPLGVAPPQQPVVAQPTMYPAQPQPVAQQQPAVQQPVVQQPVVQQPAPPQPVVQQPAPQPPQPTVAAQQPAPPRPEPAPRYREPAAPRVRQRIASRPEPAPPPEPSGGGGSGTLVISTVPASRCSAGGQTFSTPRRVELAAGTYRVSCRNDDLNVSANFSVTIRGGQATRELNHPLN